MKNCRKKITYLLILTRLLSSSCFMDYQYVKVNIIGYPKLDSFQITLNTDSVLFIDHHKVSAPSLSIFPKQHTYQLAEDQNMRPFSFIEIQSHGTVFFVSPAGNQSYTGDFSIRMNGEQLSIINTVRIKDYFASVLGSEMGEGFSEETLKAQAIAIRTYFYTRKDQYHNEKYDINNADGRDIVYRGSAFATPLMYQIMEQTKGQILTDKEGKKILPLFHSTSGGIILKDEVMQSDMDHKIKEPVLFYDKTDTGTPLSADSPYFHFQQMISKDQILKMIQPRFQITQINDIVLSYFPDTPCVNYMGFIDQNMQVHWLKAYQFLSLAQRSGFHHLQSIQFNLQFMGTQYYFTGKGFGHLCGMSQYSAEKLAQTGHDYQKILKTYYPEYQIKKLFYKY
jgi:stage II sporulation protein D